MSDVATAPAPTGTPSPGTGWTPPPGMEPHTGQPPATPTGAPPPTAPPQPGPDGIIPPVPPMELPAETKPADAKTEGEGEPKSLLGDAVPKPFTDAELKVPEGIAFEGDQRKEFGELVSKFGLTHDGAQAMLDYGGKLLKEAAEGPSRAFAETNERWQKETQADPEIGGARFDSEVRPGIARLMDEYSLGPKGRQELVEALNVTGAGNHPAIIKFLSRIAKVVNEGKPVNGSPPGQRRGPIDPAKAMYPNNP